MPTGILRIGFYLREVAWIERKVTRPVLQNFNFNFITFDNRKIQNGRFLQIALARRGLARREATGENRFTSQPVKFEQSMKKIIEK